MCAQKEKEKATCNIYKSITKSICSLKDYEHEQQTPYYPGALSS